VASPVDSTLRPAPPPRPPAPTPPEKPLGFWGLFRALNANPIAAWSRQAYQEPYLHFAGGRVRPDILFVTDPVMVRRIFVEAPTLYDKGDVVRRRLSAALGDGLLIASEESWRPQRRIAAPLFQTRRVEAFAPEMLAAAHLEADRLAGLPAGVAFDMLDAMLGVTYDIIARTAFSSEGVSNPAAFSRAIAAYFDTLGRVDLASYMRLPEWVPTLARLKARPALALFRREIGGLIERRRERLDAHGLEGVPDDLLTRMLVAQDPQTGQRLPPGRIYDNAVTFLAAGHETTATLLCWTFFLLSDHPDWDARVVEELDRVIGDADPTPELLARLATTRMVLDEALRLYPPAPLIPRMALEADRLGPVNVRKGTIVFTSPYVSQRHRSYWERPDDFHPERFAPGVRETIDRYVYFPFGAGPRICIGAGFAMQEALTVLAILLRRYRFIVTRRADVFPRATITLKPGDTLMMRLERR
jgi:cytochrome P450